MKRFRSKASSGNGRKKHDATVWDVFAHIAVMTVDLAENVAGSSKAITALQGFWEKALQAFLDATGINAVVPTDRAENVAGGYAL